MFCLACEFYKFHISIHPDSLFTQAVFQNLFRLVLILDNHKRVGVLHFRKLVLYTNLSLYQKFMQFNLHPFFRKRCVIPVFSKSCNVTGFTAIALVIFARSLFSKIRGL